MAAIREPAVVVDPLWLLVVMSLVPTSTALGLRLLWFAVFIMTLLLRWNIQPALYGFYLSWLRPTDVPLFRLDIAFALASSALFLWRRPVGLGPRRLRLLGALAVLLFLAKAVLPESPRGLESRLVSPVATFAKYSAGRAMSSVAPEWSGSDQRETPTFSEFIGASEPMPRKVLFVLVESWAESPQALLEITAAISRIGGSVIDVGFTQSRGATLAGEIRELCGVGEDLKWDFDPGHLSGCAPQRLARLGYRVVAWHGFNSKFYLRNQVWTRFGIDEQYFLGHLQDARICHGSFVGVCDVDLVDRAFQALREPGPVFAYVLTLDSHEPILGEAKNAVDRVFSGIPYQVESQRVARSTIGEVLSRAAAGQVPGLLVYIAGDHPPPSLGASMTRSEAVVPYLVIRFE